MVTRSANFNQKGANMSDTYNLESVYDEQIAPLMTQIIAICKEHKLPMLASFQYGCPAEEEYDFCTTQLFMEGRPISNQLERAAVAITSSGHLAFAMTITSEKKA